MAVLPQASVAINVLVTVYSLAQVPGALHHVEMITLYRRRRLLLVYQMME